MTRAENIAKRFKELYPNPKTELIFANEMQLVVAVMLSAQTTDKKVNQVTKSLFEKYKTWEDFSKASLSALQKDIYGVNFHLGKAERLIAAGCYILTYYSGSVPHTLDQLVEIPGIARKSANVILQELWDVAEGIVVDTHVTRVTNRLGLTKQINAMKIEKELMSSIPQQYWRNFSGAVVLHGRYICTARSPKCSECGLLHTCSSGQKSILGYIPEAVVG